MNRNVYSRDASAKLLALLMALVMAFVFVSSDIPTKAEAAQRVYVSEVMIFYGDDFDDAVKECKAAGFIPVESDLNKTAYEDQIEYIRKHMDNDVHDLYGDIGNAVVLGYKTTLKRELAITNLSMLQMGIGYDTHKYEDYMKLRRSKFEFMAKTVLGVRDEFKANKDKGSPAAEMALKIMNYYRYDEENMGLGDYILSDKCSNDKLTYLFQHANGSIANTVFGAMVAAVADYNPNTVYSEGEYTTDVQPAEPIPDTELPELPEPSETNEGTESEYEEDLTGTYEENFISGSENDAEGTPTESTAAESTESTEPEDNSDKPAEDTSSVEETVLPVETEHKESALTDSEELSAEQEVVLHCDPNYGTWADRVSKTGMAEKYELGQIDKDDVKAYANSADTLIDALQTFAKNYMDAAARESTKSEAAKTDIGTDDTSKLADKMKEGAVNGSVTEDQADLFYIGIYDMLSLYPYDENMNLAEYIIELGSKDYTDRESKYCIYPLAAAMTHGQIEMMQYNGVGSLVTYLYNNENILKEFDKYAKDINKEINEHKNNGENTISVWEGVDKTLFDSNIAFTSQTTLDQSAGRINDDVKKPYGLQTWLSDVQYKINIASSILGGVNAIISIGTMLYAHSLTNGFTAAACAAYMGTGGALSTILGAAGWMMITAASWMGVIALALLIIIPLVNLMLEQLEKDAMDYVSIPKYVVDTNNGNVCLFNVVMGSNGKAGDLSAGMGKPAGRWRWNSTNFIIDYSADQRPRWNALYYTLDPDAGSPICLDDDGNCFKVQTGNLSAPKGTVPLKTFNEDAAANMNSYVREEKADNIYVFYTTEDSIAKINQPKTLTDEENAGRFISKIKLSVGESETEAKTNLTRAGFKIVDANLTPGKDKNYTYLGYSVQTTDDKAVTDIRISPKTKQPAVSYGSASYGNAGDMKNGDSLFYSSYTQVGDAITTDFMVVNNVADAKEGYEPITTFGGLPYNFNRVLDYQIGSSTDPFPYLFGEDLNKTKERLGTPVYVFFRPSKSYSKNEIEKDGKTAQEYISGIGIFECVPHESRTYDWKTEKFTDYIKDYAETVGAEVYENNLLDGVKYGRGLKEELSFGGLGTPKSYFLVTKTYNPKRAVYGIKSYTASPGSSMLPSCIGSASTGGYAAAEVTVATTAHEIEGTVKDLNAFYGYSATHDYLNFIAAMESDSFDKTGSGLKMKPEDFEKEGYWKNAKYSKVYENYKTQVTREYTYLRSKNIFIEGAADGKNPITPEQIAFTDTPAEKLNGGMIKTLSGKSVSAEGFYSVQDARTPNAPSAHNLGFSGADGGCKEQYIYIKREPVENAYISSVMVASFDVAEAAGSDAGDSEKEAYAKAGYDTCIQQLLSGCTDEILPYNMCVFNVSNVGCMKGFTDTLVSEAELKQNLINEVLKSEYGKKLVSVRNEVRGKRVVTVRDTNIGAKIKKEMQENWQLSDTAEKTVRNFAYMGVSRTDSPSRAVTALLRFKATEDKEPDQTVYVGGNKYTLCGGKIRDVFLGDYYLYQSYDSGAGSPLTAVDFGMVPFINDAVTALYADSSGISSKDNDSRDLGSGHASNYIYCYSDNEYEYIDAIYIGTGDTVFDACSDLLAAGARRAVLYDVRHNARTGSDKDETKYTLIGYSQSKATRRNGKVTRAKGVRDIVIVKAEDENGLVPDILELNGLNYIPAQNGSGIAAPINAADGTYIYYYTASSDKVRPLITKLGISERDRVPDVKDRWENVLTSDNKRYNLNEGIFTFKDGTKFLTDSRAYLYCKRQEDPNNYVKPGAAVTGGHCEENVLYGELYLKPSNTESEREQKRW